MKLVLLLVFCFTNAVSVNVDKCCPLNRKFIKTFLFLFYPHFRYFNSRVDVFGLNFMLKINHIP